MTTRREFLTTTIAGSSVVSFGLTPPSVFLQAAEDSAAYRDETILVVVQLSGGNDGLNTVVPFADSRYHDARPTLAVRRSDVLKIDDHFGWHPAARGLADLLESNRLGIVQGVGYPNPNRSHFESMDIWHSCVRKDDRRGSGWVGRFLEATKQEAGGDVPAMHLGAEKQPFALASQDIRVPSVRSLDRFRLDVGGNERVRSAIADLNRTDRKQSNDLLGFVQSSTTSALKASERIESATSGYKTSIMWPESGLAKKLQTVAQLIDSGLSSRVYYVTLDGFDTHSQQGDAHAALLREFSGAVLALLDDLAEHGHADRTLVMGFSEFGRRLKENASEGTDHGAAAPMFLAGPKARQGLIGQHPSLGDLNDGDVKFHTDFRRVYAGVLKDWLGVDPADIVGKQYARLSVIT